MEIDMVLLWQIFVMGKQKNRKKGFNKVMIAVYVRHINLPEDP